MSSVLICFAVSSEATPFKRLLKASHLNDVQVLVTGMGRENASRAAAAALASLTPNLVLTCGFAGGLNPELRAGCLLWAGASDPRLINCLTLAGAREAKFLCADQVATTALEKARLRQTHSADAVEMESAAILQLCHAQRIPCATLRIVLDEAGEDLPLDFEKVMGPGREISPVKLAVAVVMAPGKIPALIQLGRRSSAAAMKLAETIAAVVKAWRGAPPT